MIPERSRTAASARAAVYGRPVPTVMRRGPYRFFFYSGDRSEPRHVHVERDYMVAKFWLEPVRIAGVAGFRPVEVLRVKKLISAAQDELLARWNEFFSAR